MDVTFRLTADQLTADHFIGKALCCMLMGEHNRKRADQLSVPIIAMFIMNMRDQLLPSADQSACAEGRLRDISGFAGEVLPEGSTGSG